MAVIFLPKTFLIFIGFFSNGGLNYYKLKTEMMKNFIKLIFAVTILVLASCSPKFYTPNTQNVPLLTEKGETNLTLAGNTNQVEFQGAYAVTQHFALQANGGLFIPADLDNGNGGSGKFIEVGGGYFNPIDEHWVFEAYGLIGIGNFENHFPSSLIDYPETTGDISANILRVGIQPNFGYKSKYFSAAISTRISNISYNNIQGSLVFDDDNQIDYLEDNSSNLLFEPALTVKGGIEKFKLQLQYGYSFNLTNADFMQDESFFTVGINFNFN